MRVWLLCGAGAWVIALALAGGGLWLARRVLDRGVAYGASTSAVPRTGSLRAVNVQLEIEPDDAAVARTLDLVRDAGFGWIRQQVSWADLEPGHKGNFWDGSRGQATWARLDAIAKLAQARGIRVVARVDLPPDWARPAGSFRTHPPSNVRDYADIVAAITSRYRGQIDHVQVWNEPNLREEWGRESVDPVAYVELLRAGFEGARRGNANAVVVVASLAQTLEPDVEGGAGVDDLTYLDRMYASGAAPFFDVAAANGYGLWTGPDDRQVGAAYTNLSRLLLVREVMARHGDAGKPLWVSEFGWNAEPPGWRGRPSPWGRVDEATQAVYMQGAWHRAEREWPWIGPMAVWLMRQPRPAADDPTQFFALLREDWTPRPAYDALLREVRAPVLGSGTWPADSAGIDYVGTWRSSPGSGGIRRETPAPNAQVRVHWSGTRIDLIAPVGPQRGVAYVTVDGSYLLAGQLPRNRFGQAMIDFGAPIAAEGVRIPIASGLPDGPHSLELTVSGDAGTGSTAPGVGIDGVVITRDRSTAPETLLAVTSAASVVAGAWSVRRPVRAWIWAQFPWHVGVTNAAIVPKAARAWPDATEAGVWLGLATVAALPLAALSLATPVGRFSPVEVLAVAAIAACGAERWLGRGRTSLARPYRETRAPRLAALEADQWAALLLFVGGTIGAIVATYPAPAWREWRLLIAEPVLWYAVVGHALVRHPGGVRWLATALVWGAALAGIVAIAQALTGIGVVDAEGALRARAFSPSPNNLALLLGRTLPLALALVLTAPHPLRPERFSAHAPPWLIFPPASPPRGEGSKPGGSVAKWLPVFAIGVGLALTWSRGGILAGLVSVAWLVWRRWGSPSWLRNLGPLETRPLRISRLVWIGVAVAFVAACTAVASTSGRVRSVMNAEGSGLLRLSVWESAVAMVRDHPWLGVGLDQFVYVYPRYLQADAWREPNLSHPHQLVLDAWLRLGVLGLGALVALGWGVWRRNALADRSGDGDASMRDGATAALMAVVVHGLVDNSYFVLDLAYATLVIVLIHRGSAGRAPSAPASNGGPHR